MSILLAIETATEGCSVAVWQHGTVLERFEIAPRRHAELLLPWCDALLAEAGVARSQIDAIACGRGPGAFTGVRLAVAAAQGMALGLGRPLIGVSTLAALAVGVRLDDSGALISDPHASGEQLSGPLSPVFAAIDARMGEVYAAAFRLCDDGDVEALDDERIGAPDSVALPEANDGDDRWLCAGTGFAAGDAALRTRMMSRMLDCRDQALPRAAAIAYLAAHAFERGEALPPEHVQPAYLRNKVALSLIEQRAARAEKEA